MSDHPTLSELDTASVFSDRHIGPGPEDRATMLAAVGFDSLDALMDAAVPGGIRSWITLSSAVRTRCQPSQPSPQT